MQTVIITGGSSGIGLGLAKEYSKKGANIVLLARNQQRLDSAVIECKEIASNSAQQITSFSLDVTNKQQLDDCVEKINASIGNPDLLILSAGIIDCVRLVDQSDEKFDAIMQTNVMGSRVVARAFLPTMINNKSGQICFIASLGGLISTYGYSAYSASKYATIGMAGALRQELAEYNIGVTVVCPPEVDTPMIAKEADYILPQTRFAKDLGGTLSVQKVVKSVVKGLSKNSFMIIPGLRAKFSYWNARVFPRTFMAIMQMFVRLSSK